MVMNGGRYDTYDAYSYAVKHFAVEDAGFIWRVVDGLIPASVIIKLRGNTGNCQELSRFVVENTIGTHLIYLTKDYVPTYDYRYALHCAVELDEGTILDVSYACGKPLSGIFNNKDEWSSCIKHRMEG